MKLPRTIYVKIVKENDGEVYLIADEDINNIVLSVGDKMKIGIYERVETIMAKGVLETETIK
jgi:hypothetical protein